MPELKGNVEKIVYANVESGFTVFRVKDSLGQLNTAVGLCPPLAEGQTVFLSGQWVEDKKWGSQIKVEKVLVDNPKTKKGILKFISSGFLPGIGETFARKITTLFKEDALRIIADEPARLTEIPGLGIARALKASRALKEQGAVAEVIAFLQSYGLGIGKAKKLVELHGLGTVELLKANPYKLVGHVEGFGFKSVDELALQLGFAEAAAERLEAATKYLLKQASNEGHLFLPSDTLLVELEKLLGFPLAEIPQSDDLVFDQERVYSQNVYKLEREVADRVGNFIRDPFKPLKVDLIQQISQNLDLELSSAQAEAIRRSAENKISVITGGPGTGKSTLTKVLVKLAQGQGKRVALCAPTGRAAQRLEEICGVEASTIHRLLKYDPTTHSFQHNESNPLETDFLLCDESSMLDLTIARDLFRALPPEAQVVFVGDRDQLPPVGAGQFFHDLLECEFHVSKLDKIFRQSAGSGIIAAAHQINQGEVVAEKNLGEEFYFIEESDPQLLQDKLVELVTQRIPKKFGIPSADVQVLSPMYRGLLGVDLLNLELQKKLNPDPTLKIPRRDFFWGVADRVVVLKNNYEKEIFNGDLGTIESMNLESQELVVAFDRGYRVTFSFDELDLLSLAYALSVHKSQGSEFPAVVIPVSTQHYRMLRRKLLYTALTRAKKLCVIVGSRRAFQIAVKNFQEQPRFSYLKERIMTAATE